MIKVKLTNEYDRRVINMEVSTVDINWDPDNNCYDLAIDHLPEGSWEIETDAPFMDGKWARVWGHIQVTVDGAFSVGPLDKHRHFSVIGPSDNHHPVPVDRWWT